MPDSLSMTHLRRCSFSSIVVLCLISLPALAHHPLDGQAMTRFSHGFLSGLAHPILGIDHLLFLMVLAVSGVLFGRLRHLLVAALVGTMAGLLITLLGTSLSFNEMGIALSLVTIGVAVLWKRRQLGKLNMLVIGVFSVFHGSAYATALVEQGAPAASVIWGFVLALPLVYGLVVAAVCAGARVLGSRLDHERLPAQIVAGLATGMGVALMASHL